MSYLSFRRLGLAMACAIVTLCSAASAAPSTIDTVHRGMSILYIGTINADCYPDTVWGARKGTLNEPFYLAEVIVWGQHDETGKRGRKDTTAHCKGHIPTHLKVPYTLLSYPDWQGLRGSLTAMRFNPEDTLSDMLFALRGMVTSGDETRDTMRMVVIFGQSGLDTLRTIDLATLPAVQAEPFTAMELRKGSEVTNEKRRDFSGRTSYELHRVGFREQNADSNGAQPSPPVTTAGVMRVYPNPAGVAAQVEGAAIPAGEYNVEIVAVNGEVRDQQEVTVEGSGSFLKTINVERLPTGYYIIRLRQRGGLVGTYPIVVTH